MRAFYGLSWLA